MKEIIIATKNAGKVREFANLFAPLHIKVKSLLDFSEHHLPEIKETGQTFAENARIKAETIATIMKRPVIADDSGLIVDALGVSPGIFSARFAGEGATDKQNYEKLLAEMAAEDERTAKFIALLALARPGHETVFFEGICAGKIALSPAGENGFGYDPVFIPDGYDRTMAELDATEKNQISHRFHALQLLKKWLENNTIN